MIGDRVVWFPPFIAVSQAQPLAQGQYEERFASVLLFADPDNAGNILLGDSSRQPFKLVPGAALSLDITNLSDIYYAGSAGDKLIVVATTFSTVPGQQPGIAYAPRGLGPTSRF
jgi:hypothetical protein